MSGWVPALPPGWRAGEQEPAFQGRLPERETLGRLLAAADGGDRQVVFLSGEAGGGKSRLAAEALRPRADDGTAAVLVGHCLPDYPVAYEPFLEPLRALTQALGQGSGSQLQEGALRLLTELVEGRRDGATEGDQGRLSTQRHFDAVVSALDHACAERLVVLVLEDVHWATASTIALLSYLVRRTARSRLLVLATYRPDPPDRSDELTGAIAELANLRGVHRMKLSGLDVAEVAAVLRAEVAAHEGAVGALAERLHERTGGNPFVIVETCRDLREGGDLGVGTEIPVPATVRDTFAARLSQLADSDRWLVTLVAVLGERVSVPLLRACAPAGVDLVSGLERAAGLGLIVGEPEWQGLRFPHSLARDAILESTSAVKLAELHAVAARGLESRPARTLAEVRRLAHHYARALTLDERREKTRHYLQRAGLLAERSMAYDEAAECYEQVAALADSDAEREAALLGAIDAKVSAGRYTAVLEGADHLARHASDPATRVAAAVRFEFAAGVRRHEDRAVELLGDALRETRIDVADPLVVEALASLSRALAQVGDVNDAVRLGEPTLGAARRLGDAALLSRVLYRLIAGTEDYPGLRVPTLARSRELVELARGQHDYFRLGWATEVRCHAAFAFGDPVEAAECIDDLHLAADRTGHAWFDWFGWLFEIGLHFRRGNFSGAESKARWAHRVGREWPEAETDHLFGTQMLLIRRETGRLDAVASTLTGREPLTGNWAPGLLALYAGLGMTGPARHVLEAMAGPEVLAANRGTAMWPAALAHLTEAAILVGDRDVLSRLRPYLDEFAGQYLDPRPLGGFYATAEYHLASLDAALDEGDPLGLFDAAAELDRRSGSAVHLAATLAARASYRASRDGPGTPSVKEDVAEARAIAQPIGQVRVLTMLDTLSTAAGLSPGPVADTARGAGLSEREMEVLRLLVEGDSNRSIAERLYISENTAAKHVRSILAKTHTGSRTAAAHHALTHGWIESG